MNCVEAEKHFGDLLDHGRDERRRQANDHLAACARCRQELAALAECQGLVSALPPIEPPAGFTTRVMAEVRDAAHRPRIWQLLSSPIQKLPLQAAAVILISVLAVFIYQKESGQRESTSVPPPSRVQKQAEADKLPPADGRGHALEAEAQNPDPAGAQESRMKRLPQTEEPRSPSELEEQSKIIGDMKPGAGKAPPPLPSGNPARVAPSQPNKESAPADQAGSVRQEQSLRSGGAQAKGVPGSAPLRDNDTAAQDRTLGGSPSSAGLEEKRARSSFDAPSSSTAGFADRQLILHMKQPVRDNRNTEAGSELERRQTEASPSQTGFNDLDHGRQRAIQTGQPQTVSVIMDASQYDGFKKELARSGKIESEASAPANETDALSKSSRPLRITITILPPNSSAQPPSTR